jgi:arginine-tRNA-protein transferase
MILDQIERTRKRGLPYLYLGYFIEESPKMAYKARFLPQERLSIDGWQRVKS